MFEEYWENRGKPWEHDAGPPANRRWAQLFAETPNYRAIGKDLLGREGFRWHFGPMFYRGRLGDGEVKVLIIGQEGAQDESLAHRSFSGGTGARMQYFLQHIGLTRSYLFLNTFVYPIFGQYTDNLKWLAQNEDSPIVQHRHAILNYVAERNELRLIIAVGRAAKETVVTWIKSHGGTCSSGTSDLSRCRADVIGPHAKAIGVLHPGGAGKGGSVTAIIADFKKAIRKIQGWADDDPTWLPPDAGASRKSADEYRYRSAPIPFQDLPYGTPWRVGRGGTSSNRKDSQRSIQIFSASGKYNGQASYSSAATGSRDGYAQETGDVPYEPPCHSFRDFDPGPTESMARLLMGGESGLDWPDFKALGIKAHTSFGTGPIYRGRFSGVKILILGDQESHDDLFTGRALTGEAGQHLQEFLRSMGITRSYLILRVLPVDCLGLNASRISSIVDHAQVRVVYSAIVQRVAADNALALALAVGPHAQRLAAHVLPSGLPVVSMKAWRESGVLSDWQRALNDIQSHAFTKDIASASFNYDGRRGQIPRLDLPYGTLRWQGSSGDRAVRASGTGPSSMDYYKVFMPQWAFKLAPEPLSQAERDAIERAPE
ncbi:MAG: uracil-DNA glycosylase family protein [Anaerolineales bacterium]